MIWIFLQQSLLLHHVSPYFLSIHILMKKKILFAAMLLCLATVGLQAQTRFVDAAAFPLLGKATEQTLSRYERLPDSCQTVSLEKLWLLGRNSAGLAIRFRSNSTQIAARWETRNNFRMNHMTPTGICGLDLYCLDGDHWHFAGSGRPTGKLTTATIVRNMTPEMREYLLFLPLYDGPISLEIGVDTEALIEQPQVNLPRREKPILFYGTSIMQGGCATRPGMAHTNILERRLQRECINLGFSGSAHLDMEIADLIASVDAALYILDFVPNATVEEMDERAVKFISKVRAAHPDAPILLVEDPRFTHIWLDQKMAEEVRSRNAKVREVYELLKKQGDRNLYFLTSERHIGTDDEACVDGIHFTDLGFMRYADVLQPIIELLVR